MKKLAGLATGVLLLSSLAAPAFASGLTSPQVSAIIGLLQSFGADQSVINNVSVALGGQTSGGLSCASFADVSYGTFDNNPGGRVSQLQTWLGFPSNTFGFGTYGQKTQAAWNVMCATNLHPLSPLQPQPTPYPQPQPTSQPTATIDQGSLTKTALTDYGQLTISGNSANVSTLNVLVSNQQGKQAQSSETPTTNGRWSVQISSLPVGTYTVSVFAGAGNSTTLAAGTLVVNPRTSAPASTATIDQSSLTVTTDKDKALVTLTGAASNISNSYSNEVSLYYVNTNGTGSTGGGYASVVNGRWSWPASTPLSLATGTYTVQVKDPGTGTVLTSGTLTVNANGQTTAISAVMIDQSSLTSSSNNPVITGVAKYATQVSLTVVDSSGAVAGYNADRSGVVSSNGSWSINLSYIPNGTYTIRAYEYGKSTLLTSGTLTVSH